MPTFITNPQNLDTAQAPDLPLSLGESIKTGFEEAAMSGPFWAGMQMQQVREANQRGQRIPKEEAKRMASERGFPDLGIPDAGMTDAGLEVMLTLAEDRREGEEKLSRASGPAAMVGGLVGSMADPIGAGLNFIPIVGEGAQAKILAQASIKAGFAGRVAARAGIGAAEGLIGGALTVPFNAVTKTALGGDYTVDDAFAELGSSAVMGAAFAPAIGAVGEGVGVLADRSSHSWVREKFGTKSQEWRQLVEHDKRIGEAVAKDHPEVSAEPDRAAPISEDIAPVPEPVALPNAPKEVTPKPYERHGGWQASPFKREPLQVVSGMRDALGDRPVLREAIGDPVAKEIAGALKAHEGEIVKAPQSVEPIARAADALVLDRSNAMSFDEATRFGSVKNLSPVEQIAASALHDLNGQPERMARMVGEYIAEAKKGAPPEAAMASAIERVSDLQGPTEKGRVVSDVTRERAQALVLYQAEQGARIDAETVIASDPKVGTASAADVQRSVVNTSKPEGRYDAPDLKAAHEEAKSIGEREFDGNEESFANDAEAEVSRIEKAIEEGRKFSQFNAPTDSRRFKASIEIDPNDLVFRESMQNRTSDVSEMFPEGQGYTPIVVIDNGKSMDILDGHNRAAVAKDRGDVIPASVILKSEYDALIDAGLDDMEIAYAAHVAAGERDAAEAIDQQFVGAKVSEKGEDGAYDLREMRKSASPDTRMAEGVGAVMAPAEIIRAQIAERFGEDVVKFGEKNGFSLVNDWTEIPGATSERVLGMAEGGKAYISARSLAERQGPSVYLHEMGAHIGMRKMLGKAGFAEILAKSDALIAAHPELAAVLRSSIPSDTPHAYRSEEALAYMVQRFEEGIAKREDWWPKGAQWAHITDPTVRRAVVEFVREIVAKVKAWAYEKMPSLRGSMNLAEADFHAIAVRSLQSTGEAASGSRFAKAVDPVKSELEIAREASKKARGVYKQAYDRMAAIPSATDDQLVTLAMSVGEPKLTKAEAEGLVKRFRKYGGDIMAAQKEEIRVADIDRYRAAQNVIAFHKSIQFIEQFKGEEVEGALARDAGSEKNIPGARISVEGNANKWQALLSNAAEHEFRAAGVLEVAKRKEFSRPILDALYDIQTGADTSLTGKSYNAEMLAAARIMDKYTLKAAKKLKELGVEMGDLKGRMLAQEHDMWALRNFANEKRTGATRSAIRERLGLAKIKIGDPAHKKAWVEFITPLLREKTLDGRDVTPEYLDATYDTLAGYRAGSQKVYAYTGGEFKSKGVIPGEASRISDRSRKLPFKDPESWWKYQERCGNPNLLENFFGELRSSAKSIGVIETYGPGGEFTRAAIHDAIGQGLAGVDAAKWQNGRKARESQWAVTSGAIDIPGSEVLANVMSSTRHLTTAAIMGSAVLSQVGDVVNIGHWRAIRYNKGAMGVWAESAKHIASVIRGVGRSETQKKLLSAWASDLDSTIGGMIRSINEGDAKGAISNMAAKVYDISGFSWLNRNNKNAQVIGLSHWLGQESRMGWNEIEPTTREMLELYDFKESDWEMIRKGEQIAEDGKSYMTPEGLDAIPDADIVAHISKDGAATTEATPGKWREEMKGRLVGMMSDAVAQAMSEPTGREKRIMTGGTEKGTWVGEAVRSMWQAKSFAVSQLTRAWGLERNARSLDPRAVVKRGSSSHYQAVASYIAALTAAGYLSYTIKGWAAGTARRGLIEKQGQTEDDRVLFFDLPVIDDRVLFASMAQGGSLGIYGDFLFAEKDRFGGGLMQTLSGPTVGKLEDVYRLWTLAKTMGDDSAAKAEAERGAFGNQFVRMVKGITPYSNLWYAKFAADNLIWWRLQEAINPGALDRLERSAKNRGDQYIFTKPSDIAR